jgi:hypothetical protein
MLVTRDGNMASSRIGKLWLAASGDRPITDLTWREYLDQAAASVKSAGPFSGLLFWAPKHGPSGSQRRMLTREYAESVRLDAQRHVALVSDSALVRGTITAINWITRSNMLAFAPQGSREALDWLAKGVPFDRKQAERALEGLIGAVGAKAQPSRTS